MVCTNYVGIRKTVVFDARVFHKVFITVDIAEGRVRYANMIRKETAATSAGNNC